LKSFKNHEHLLAVKHYDKPSTDFMIEDIISEKLDPYSKQPITKPVKNKICKHIYDQHSIELMLKKKIFISCAYIGCVNKRFTKKDLLYNLDNSSDGE
jgi:SUMO ligase MMS21 Smc5/6 complex component